MQSEHVLVTRVEVPFVDLRPVNAPFREQFADAVGGLLESGALVNGPQVADFEHAFAAYCRTAECVGTSSGIDALRLGLLALGIEERDEVVVSANAFVATFGAIVQAGGRPVVVDVTESDYNLDSDQFEAALTPRTHFVVPVHLYGQLADMRRVNAIAHQSGVRVLEDACQAHGASRDGLRAGAAGAAAAFSFYPTKPLGAAGDAGAVTTDDPDLAGTIRALREHGQRQKHEYELAGWTARLDTVQAILLLAKLGHVDRWNAERNAAAAFYGEALENVGDLVLPRAVDGSEHAWHLYVVRTSRRDDLGAFLEQRGIGVGVHYPQPVHLSPAYSWLGYGEGAFPMAEALARELLSLPLFVGINERQLEWVAESVRAFFERG